VLAESVVCTAKIWFGLGRVRAQVKAIYIAAPEEATGWNLCLGKFDEQNDALPCLDCVVTLLAVAAALECGFLRLVGLVRMHILILSRP